MQLVPGRECGECSVCCVLLNIDTPEFQKMPRTDCAHLAPGGKSGCTIHATRPPVCRSYNCAWRYLKGLGEDWRPDRSGVLVDFQTEGLPAHYPKRPGIRLTITGPAETLFLPGFVAFLSGLLTAEVPVVIAMPGPAGHYPVGTFVNDVLKDAVAAQDSARIATVLRDMLRGLEGHVFQPVAHRHRPPASSA